MAKKQLPIKDILRAIDTKDRDWYNNLSAEDKKLFGPWILMRWMSSVNSGATLDYLILTNMLVNQDFSIISKDHPELQWLLMTACGQGKVEYHKYIKPPNARKPKDKISEFIMTLYPTMKMDDVKLFKEINTLDDFKELAKSNGYSDKEIKELFK